MILLYTEASPFARKCRLCIAELGAGQDIALRDVGAVSPLAANAAASAQAPLGKIRGAGTAGAGGALRLTGDLRIP